MICLDYQLDISIKWPENFSISGLDVKVLIINRLMRKNYPKKMLVLKR